MASSATQRKHTFINLTDDPLLGKDERRIFVRRTVMSDYHKRRKRPTHARDTAPNQPLVDTAPAELIGGPYISTQIPVTGGKPAMGKLVGVTGGRKTAGVGVGAAGVGASSEAALIAVASVEAEVEAGEGAGMSDSRTGDPGESPEFLDPLSRALFQPRFWPDQNHAQTSRITMGFLRGQPLKAARNMSYVSFIHRRYRDMCGQDDRTSHPLTICGEVLRACVADHTTLWDRVRQQQENIYSQIESFGRWKLLSAAQAITLYILLWLRPGDGHGRFQHGNIALLFTLGKIYKFLQACHLHTDAEGSTLRPVHSWEDWIFQESCFRVATVYFLLTLLVDTDIKFPCDGPTDWCIEKMPLPANQTAWEADNEIDWLAATGESLSIGSRPSFGGIFGKGDVRPSEYDDSWADDLDEMGLVVAMAGSLHIELSKE